MSRQQKTSSSSEKQDNWHPHRGRDPHHPHLTKWALLGQRKEHNTFTSSSQSVCGQKTLVSENRPLPQEPRATRLPPPLVRKTHKLYIENKLALCGDKATGSIDKCYVLCPTYQVPTPSSSIFSPIKAVSWIHQQPSSPANHRVFQLDILLLYEVTRSEETVIFQAIEVLWIF